jgi:hypothetical protein
MKKFGARCLDAIDFIALHIIVPSALWLRTGSHRIRCRAAYTDHGADAV